MVRTVPHAKPNMIVMAMETQKTSCRRGTIPKIVVAAALTTGLRREIAESITA